MQKLGGRRDRVTRQQQRQAAADAGGDQPERQRLGSVDIAVRARRHVRGASHVVLNIEQLGRLTERPSGLEGLDVGLRHGRLGTELLLYPLLGDVGGPAVHPREQAQREQVLCSSGVPSGGALDPFHRARGQRRHGDAMQAVGGERTVLERVGVVAGLFDVALREGILVGHDRRAFGQLGRLARSAAGFIATSTLGASPGVRMSREAKWIWKAETPASVPAGARISAGKFGSVARSLPSAAVASVNRVPASCMPSPESPAKRTTTRSRSSTVLVTNPLEFPPASTAY